MQNSNDIMKLVNELHDKGIVNLDTPIRNLIEPEGIGFAAPTTRAKVHILLITAYALVTTTESVPSGSGVDEVRAVADAVREEMDPPQSIRT